MLLTYYVVFAKELAFSAVPLPLRDERHAVALLVNGKITTIAENDGIGVFAITIIANGAFCVLFFTRRTGFSIDSCCRSRPWSLGLRSFRRWFGYS